MTREEIDVLWNRALHEAVQAREEFTRYHFAAMIAAAEREECAKGCDEMAQSAALAPIEKYRARFIADAIRARGQQ